MQVIKIILPLRKILSNIYAIVIQTILVWLSYLWHIKNPSDKEPIISLIIFSSTLFVSIISMFLPKEDEESFSFQAKIYLRKAIKDFRENYIDTNFYVPLNGEIRRTQESNYENVLEDQVKKLDSNTLYCPIDSYINKWLQNEGNNLLVLIGEFGTGKTTFTKYLTHQLALCRLGKKKYLNIIDNKKRIPLLMPLRNFKKTIESFVSDTCKNELRIKNFIYPDLVGQIDNNEIILILDGFDEIPQLIDRDLKKVKFAQIRKLIESSTNSKVLITCREEYFQSVQELNDCFENKFDFQVIYLSLFDNDQIKQYLETHIPNPDFYWKHIEKTYDLNDLAKRPILLELIVKYLPGLIKSQNNKEKISTSKLYDYCINEELDRLLEEKEIDDINLPSKKDRLNILMRLAVWLYENDTLNFAVCQFETFLNSENYLQLKNTMPRKYEALINHFLNFSFLIRDSKNNYRLSHKSFRDFLTSKVFVEEINDGSIHHFAKSKASKELISFILDNQIKKDNLINLVLSAKNLDADKKWQGTNAMNILGHIDKKALKGKNLTNCQLNEVDFTIYHVDPIYNSYPGESFNGTNFKNAKLKNSKLDKQLHDASDFSGVDTFDSYFDYRTRKPLGRTDYDSNFENGVLDFDPYLDELEVASGLNLRAQGLNDISVIKKMKRLKVLKMEWNENLVDISPISNCKLLNHLDLRKTGIKDISPLKDLKNLEYLDLRDCQKLRDIGPLSNLTNLKTLALNGTDLHDLQPLNNLENLNYLILGSFTSMYFRPLESRIKDISPLKDLHSLKDLILGTMPSIESFSPLSSLTNLERLTLSKVNTIDFSFFRHLNKLELLGIIGTECKNISYIKELKNLKKLNIIRSDLNSIAGIEKLVNLSELRLRETRIKDISHVQNLRNLNELDLSSTDVESVKHLKKLYNLRKLNLSKSKVKNIKPLKSLKNLKELTISEGLEDHANEIKKFIPSLEVKIDKE